MEKLSQWNGVCLLAPYQMGPTLKTLKLKIISNGEAPSFSSAEGELDFSKIDFTRITNHRPHVSLKKMEWTM